MKIRQLQCLFLVLFSILVQPIFAADKITKIDQSLCLVTVCQTTAIFFH